jgi:hypothetical protein
MNKIINYEEFIKNHSIYLMNLYLTKYQFSEDILIKLRMYYESDVCLATQNNLSLYFCFHYLYNSEYDSADIFTDYNDIVRYYTRNGTSTKLLKEVKKEFNKYKNM